MGAEFQHTNPTGPARLFCPRDEPACNSGTAGVRVNGEIGQNRMPVAGDQNGAAKYPAVTFSDPYQVVGDVSIKSGGHVGQITDTVRVLRIGAGDAGRKRSGIGWSGTSDGRWHDVRLTDRATAGNAFRD